jgi:hypothetical protein
LFQICEVQDSKRKVSLRKIKEPKVIPQLTYYIIRVRNLEGTPKAVVGAVKLAKRAIDEGREDFRAQNGRDIDVQLQIAP